MQSAPSGDVPPDPGSSPPNAASHSGCRKTGPHPKRRRIAGGHQAHGATEVIGPPELAEAFAQLSARNAATAARFDAD